MASYDADVTVANCLAAWPGDVQDIRIEPTTTTLQLFPFLKNKPYLSLSHYDLNNWHETSESYKYLQDLDPDQPIFEGYNE